MTQSAPPPSLLSHLDSSGIEFDGVDTAYKGYARVEKHTLRHPLFRGGTSQTIQREIFVSGDAVMVMPFDPVAQSVLLIEQFRMGPHHRGDHPWIIEGIAGRTEPGEEAADVARREAQEEAGVELGEMEDMGGFFLSPGIIAEHMTFFCAKADLSNAGGVFGLDEEAEDIRALVVPLEEALAFLDAGQLVSAPTALALLWLCRHRDRLTAAWS